MGSQVCALPTEPARSLSGWRRARRSLRTVCQLALHDVDDAVPVDEVLLVEVAAVEELVAVLALQVVPALALLPVPQHVGLVGKALVAVRARVARPM